MTKDRALEELLLSLFALTDLRPLIHDLDGLADVIDFLPDPRTAPARAYIADLVRLLHQRGVIGPLFFAAVRGARPHRRDDIDRVAALFTARATQPAPLALETTCAASDVALSGSAHALRDPDTTMAQWCREHRSTLGGMLLLSVGAAALVGALGQSTTLAIQIGQCVFCLAAWLIFSGWTRPTDTNPVYRRFALRRAEALEDTHDDHHAELRAAFGAAPNEVNTAKWFTAARKANQQIARAWRLLWLFWGLLYAGLAVLTVLPEELRREEWWHYLRTVPTLLNNASSGALLDAFWIMTFVTVRIDHIGAPGLVPRRSTQLRNTVKFVVVSLWAAHLLALLITARSIGEDAALAFASLDCAFRLLSGVGAAVITAMHAGRFDSTLLGIRPRVLVWLYLWAAIQPIWPLLDLFHIAAGGAFKLTWYENVRITLFSFAWFAKLLFFVLCAWLFHTGRLEFFFLRLRRLQASVDTDWQRVTTLRSP